MSKPGRPAAEYVQLAAGLLVLFGGIGLLMGFLAGGAVMHGESPNGGSTPLLGPALMLSGVIALLAGFRGLKKQGWLFGIVAFIGLGITGVLACWPNGVVALYGLAVYLSPAGRGVFRREDK